MSLLLDVILNTTIEQLLAVHLLLALPLSGTTLPVRESMPIALLNHWHTIVRHGEAIDYHPWSWLLLSY